MNIVLLSGGSGKRLWPLSNEIRSKQFIKIFKTDSGYESMVQRVYRQIKNIVPNSGVTITTSKTQVSAIRNQLGEAVGISVEPCRRDTFPAIALATAYLIDVKGINPEESVVVCPVDPYVEDEYFLILNRLCERAEKEESNLVLLGIEPTYPSEKYGYIIPDSKENIARVLSFKEKPNVDEAQKFIDQGALWNGGVFAYKLGYIRKKTSEMIGYTDYYELFNNYEKLDRISFDYAIVEKERSTQVMRFEGSWKDIGTWNTFTEAMEETILGNVKMNDKCRNTHIINELNIPILAMGLDNIVVSASPEGILVSDKDQSSDIKPFVEDIEGTVMFAEKSWGSFQVLDITLESMTIKVKLNSGHQMNYHSHQYRDEIWIVISGKGRVILDGIEKIVNAGEIISMHAGCRHTVIADTELQIIEVQIGKEISVEDKQKHILNS